MSDIPTRALTDEYIHHLTTRITGRLREGYELADALGETLRERSPVRLEPPHSGDGTSAFGWIVRVGLLAGAGLAANYAAQLFYGKNLVDLVRDQLGGDDAGYTVDEKYAAVHGTEGAEMPDAGTTAGATAFATPTPTTGTPSSGAATSDRPTSAGAPAPQTPPPSSATKAGASAKPSPAGGDGEPNVKHTAGGEMPDPDTKRGE